MTTVDNLRKEELQILKERAQARFTAFKDAWAICRQCHDGKEIALRIWEEMEKVADVLREQRRDVQKELLCQMLQIPKSSIPTQPIENAYNEWTETTNANEFSELPTKNMNIPTKEQADSLIKDLNDEKLVPFLKQVLSAVQSVDFRKLGEPLAQFVPHGKSKEEFTAEVSEKLGVPVQINATLGDLARQIRNKES